MGVGRCFGLAYGRRLWVGVGGVSVGVDSISVGVDVGADGVNLGADGRR